MRYYNRLAKMMFLTLPIKDDEIKRYTIFTEGQEARFCTTDSWIAMNLIEAAKQTKALYAFAIRRTKTIKYTWVISLSKNYKQELAEKE